MLETLKRLLRQREEQEQFIKQLLDQVESEERDLVDAERRNIDEARNRIAEIDKQIEPLETYQKQLDEHRWEIPDPPGDMQPGGQPDGGESRTGRRGSPLGSAAPQVAYRSAGAFVVDYIRSRGYPGGNSPADVDAAARVAAALQVRANQTTEQTPGLLPEPIIGAILTDLDGARPFIGSLAGGARDMSNIPGKIFTRPRVTQHTQVGQQTAEKAELPSRQFKVEGIPFEKDTFGGWLNVSRQDIDWTSPSAWDALITDLQNEYGAETDDFAGAAFAAGVTATVEIDGTDLEAYITALYEAAVEAATAGGTINARALRLPNHIWVSIDQWARLGAAIDMVRTTNAATVSVGSATPTSFAGDILSIPRTVVSGFPQGTLIVGRDSLFEFYEERIGLLSAIEPKVLGVEVAYGGYAASGFLDPSAFVKIEAQASGGSGRAAPARAAATKATATKATA